MEQTTETPENVTHISEGNAPAEDAATQNPIEDAIKELDLNQITADDVFLDLINKSKLYAYSLMVAAAILEKLIIKNRGEQENAPVEQNPEDQAVS